MNDCGVHARDAVSHFLLVMDVIGQGLCDPMTDLSAHPGKPASHPSFGPRRKRARSESGPNRWISVFYYLEKGI